MSEALETSSGGSEENLKKYVGDQGIVSRWLKEINLVKNSKSQQGFEKIGVDIVKKYRNANALQSYMTTTVPPARVMLNVLWSNVQIMKPTLYARMPKIVVERRFKDRDPIGRLACTVAERATSFMLSTQQDRFNLAIRSAVEDRLLCGRGQAWVRYDAEFEEAKDQNGEPLVDENGAPVRTLKPNSEKVVVDYVYWQDYFESAARTQFEVRWKAKRVYMTRAQLVQKFGELGNQVQLTYDSNGKKNKVNDEEAEFLKQAVVYEIEDNDGKQRIWISEGYKDAPLKVEQDVLKLQDFYSSPDPLLATTTTDSTYPTPDYKIYERLADEIDFVTKRISSMVDCIRFVGATASTFYAAVKDILSKDDGGLAPIDNWAQFVEKGGLRGVIDWIPFDNAIAAIQPLMQYRDDLLAKLDLITGIPDIVRGSSDPNETAAAQQRKSHWVTIKISEKQADVQRFCRQIIQKIAEIIFENGLFADETIALMCGVAQMAPDDQANYAAALQLLRDDRLRTFRVDIETDSTIATDEEEDKQTRMEYINAVSQLVAQIQNVSQFRPELLNPMIESVLFTVRAFRTGRPLEGAWEAAMQQIEDNDLEAKQNPPPPPPDYESQKLQLMSQDLQIKGQAEQFKEWIDSQRLQLEGQSQQMQFDLDSQKIQIEGMKVQSKSQIDATEQQLKAFQQQFAQFVQTQTLELEKYKVVLDEKEKFLEEARLQQQERLDAKEKASGSGKGGGAVHLNFQTEGGISVHNPAPVPEKKSKRKVVKIRRTPEGLEGEAIDIPDEEEAVHNATEERAESL